MAHRKRRTRGANIARALAAGLEGGADVIEARKKGKEAARLRQKEDEETERAKQRHEVFMKTSDLELKRGQRIEKEAVGASRLREEKHDFRNIAGIGESLGLPQEIVTSLINLPPDTSIGLLEEATGKKIAEIIDAANPMSKARLKLTNAEIKLLEERTRNLTKGLTEQGNVRNTGPLAQATAATRELDEIIQRMSESGFGKVVFQRAFNEVIDKHSELDVTDSGFQEKLIEQIAEKITGSEGGFGTSTRQPDEIGYMAAALMQLAVDNYKVWGIDGFGDEKIKRIMDRWLLGQGEARRRETGSLDDLIESGASIPNSFNGMTFEDLTNDIQDAIGGK